MLGQLESLLANFSAAKGIVSDGSTLQGVLFLNEYLLRNKCHMNFEVIHHQLSNQHCDSFLLITK